MPMDNKSAEQIATIADIRTALERIAGNIRVTPVISEPLVNELLGCELWLKCENLQRTGAFKFRGASNAIARLTELSEQCADLDIIQNKVDKVLTVSEPGIRDAMALIWRHFRMLIEPSSATVIAAICEYPEVFAGQKVGAIISGGNVDLEQLPFKP